MPSRAEPGSPSISRPGWVRFQCYCCYRVIVIVAEDLTGGHSACRVINDCQSSPFSPRTPSTAFVVVRSLAPPLVSYFRFPSSSGSLPIILLLTPCGVLQSPRSLTNRTTWSAPTILPRYTSLSRPSCPDCSVFTSLSLFRFYPRHFSSPYLPSLHPLLSLLFLLIPTPCPGSLSSYRSVNLPVCLHNCPLQCLPLFPLRWTYYNF